MRIISNEHDYYDCIQKQGQDRELIYTRKTKEIEDKFSENDFSFLNSWYMGYPFLIDVSKTLLGFCGDNYLVLNVGYKHTNYTYKYTRRWCYSIKEIDEFAKNGLKDKFLKKYNARNGQREALKNLFKAFEREKNSFPNLFEKYNCPIYAVKDGCGYDRDTRMRFRTIVINPILKEYEFFRIKNPATAFQEIAMYLSNIAKPMRPIPEVPDETLAEAKGFDKWSFRKVGKKSKLKN